MKKNHFFIALTLMAAVACAHRAAEDDEQELAPVATYEAVDDSTHYGFACDGCTDSTIVFLPDSISDPVTYNIIKAFRRHQVYGNPSVGDKLALYLTPDGKEVLQVVDIDVLKGTWVYQQLPEPRIKQMLDEDGKPVEVPEEVRHRIDSMMQQYMIPREYGIALKRDFSAQAVGGPPRSSVLEEESPMVYPSIKRYSEWHIWNGKIILSTRPRRSHNDSTQQNAQVKNDTVELVRMRRDTLVLRFADHQQKYSRKIDSLVVK